MTHYLTDTLTGEVIYAGSLEACQARLDTARALGHSPVVIEASDQWRQPH